MILKKNLELAPQIFFVAISMLTMVLRSVPSVEEAVKLITSVKHMCSKGGFRLHKFVSNSKEVIRRIPEQDRADGVKELDLDLDSLPLERALGVHWCV